MKRIIAVASLMLLGGCAIDPAELPPLPGPEAQGLLLDELGGSAQINLGAPLAPGDLAAIAILTNPDLKALRTRSQVAEAQVFSAGLYPDPRFSFGFEEALSGAGLVTALASSLGADIADMAKRPYAKRSAQAGLEAVRYDIVWAEWLTGEKARLLATRIAHLQEIKSLTATMRSLSASELDHALAAVSRGDLPASGLETRRLSAADAAERDRSAESALFAASFDLNRLLGLDPEEHIEIAVPSSPPARRVDSSVLFLTAVAHRADLAGMRASYIGAGYDFGTSRLGAFPLPTLSLNYARDTGAINTIGPSVDMSLPVWNRGRGAKALARANGAQLRADYAARLEQVRADIASATAALTILQQQLEDVAAEIAPLEPLAARAMEAAQRGDIPITSATATQLALLDKEIVETRLALAIAEAQIALEIAAGRSLETVK